MKLKFNQTNPLLLAVSHCVGFSFHFSFIYTCDSFEQVIIIVQYKYCFKDKNKNQ